MSSSSLEAPFLDLMPNRTVGAGTGMSSRPTGLIAPMNSMMPSSLGATRSGRREGPRGRHRGSGDGLPSWLGHHRRDFSLARLRSGPYRPPVRRTCPAGSPGIVRDGGLAEAVNSCLRRERKNADFRSALKLCSRWTRKDFWGFGLVMSRRGHPPDLESNCE